MAAVLRAPSSSVLRRIALTVLMRRFACCYAQGRPGAREFRTRISQVATPEEFGAVVNEFFPQTEPSIKSNPPESA